MRPPRDLPPEIAGRPFTVREATRLGVSPALLARTDLRAPHRGVRVPAHLPDSVELRARAALLVMPPGSALSGATALDLCGLPQPLGAPPVLGSPVVVSVPAHLTRPRMAGVETHRADLDGRVLHLRGSGLPVVHPTHLWIDLADELPFVDAVAVGDAVRCRGSAQAMVAALASRTAERGCVSARMVLDHVRYRVDSAMETRARLLFTGRGLPEPACGRDVVERGEWLARPDLSWPGVRVAAEFDGDEHRTDRRRWMADIARRRRLEAAGWRIVTFTALDLLHHPDELVAELAAALRERGLAW